MFTLLQKTLQGLTGKIIFDGFRKDFVLEALELTPVGLLSIGTWNISEGYTINRKYLPEASILPGEIDLRHTHFTVIICLVKIKPLLEFLQFSGFLTNFQTKPYAMLKDTTSSLIGNDRFEGFCVDLIQELSKILGFNYTFTVQLDGNNGNFDRKSKTWDGMIGQVVHGVKCSSCILCRFN